MPKREIKVSPLETAWKFQRSEAAFRKIQYDLTLEQFLALRQITTCWWCRIEGRWGGPQTATSMTTDRVDPGLGYSADNCVAACRRCNTRRMAKKTGTGPPDRRWKPRPR